MDLQLLKKKALHTLKERAALEEYNRAGTTWQWIEANMGNPYTQERLDEQAAKCEELRLKWCKINDDNRDITEGRSPALGFETALEMVAKLVDLLQPEVTDAGH